MATIYVDASFVGTSDGSLANPYVTISQALTAAVDDDTIDVAAGTYGENLNVDKAVTIVGATHGSGEPAVTVGTGTGAAVTVSAIAPGSTVSLQNLATEGGSTGVTVATTAELALVSLDNVDIANATGSGFIANDTESVDAIEIVNSAFTKNALGGSNGTGDIVIFQYNGDVTITDTTITGADEGATPRADNALQISGFDQTSYDNQGPIGTVTIDGLTATGDYDKPHLTIQGYDDLSGLSITNSALSGGTGWGYLVFIDPVQSAVTTAGAGTPGRPGFYDVTTAGTSTLDISGLSVTNTSANDVGFDVFVRGLAGDDIQTGTDVRDVLNAVSEEPEDLGGNDSLFGGGGDDILVGGNGNNELDGGTGTDTALIASSKALHTIAQNADGSYTVTRTSDGSTDRLVDIEGVQFGADADGITFELDANSPDFSGALERIASGFETDTAPFIEFGGTASIEASGSNGVSSASGTNHMRVTGPDGVFTRFDGYRQADDQGFITSIKVYLDTGMPLGEGFDYSVAANGSDGSHQRDFIFHVTKDTSTGELLVGGSNNTSFDPRENLETGNHAVINTSGWYTFEHKFYENADGALEVAMNVYDQSENWVFTEVRSSDEDVFATEYGGNRYGWFTNVDVTNGIAVDDLSLSTLDTNPVQIFDGTNILGSFADIASARTALENGAVTAATAFIETTGLDDGFFYVVDGMSIQDAVDAATAGDLIDVGAGTFAESVTLDKALSLTGAGEGVTIIDPPAGSGFDITGDLGTDATLSIDGFTFQNGVAGVDFDDNAILGTLDIDNSAFSANAFNGVRIGGNPSPVDLDNVIIENSTFTANGQPQGSSGDGDLLFFQYFGNATLRNLTITGQDRGTGPGENAIQFRGDTGAMGTVVLDNIDIDGIYEKTGIGIYGYTDIAGLNPTDVVVTAATGWNLPLNIDGVGGDIDRAGIDTSGAPGFAALQGNSDAQSISGGDGVDLLRGRDGNDTLAGGDDTDIADYSGVRADYAVTVATDAQGFATGFTEVVDQNIAGGDEGTDTLTSVEVLAFADAVLNTTQPVQLFDASDALIGTFDTIQAAVDAATGGETIRLAAETFREQVLVDGNDLTILAADGAVLESPDNGDIVSSGGYNSVLTAINGANLTVDNLDIDGRDQGNGFATQTFAGIAFEDSDGAFTNGSISNFSDTPFSGAQHGYGALLRSTDGLTNMVEISGTEISGYQKNGVDARGDGLVVDLDGNTITGSGATPTIAQNGIVLLGTTGGTINGNTISGHAYTGGGAVSVGVLLFDANDATVTNNIVSAPEATGSIGIALEVGSDAGTITGNTISGADVGLRQLGDFTTAVTEDTPAPNTYAGNTVNIRFGPDNDSTDFAVTGSDGVDLLDGNDGEDVLIGLGGDDVINGFNGGDDLQGGAGNDDISGGGGGDLIDGGLGDDSINAGTGRDTIFFSAGSDAVNGGSGRDTLVLFGEATDYSIVIRAADSFLITRGADGAVTDATSIETISFQEAEALDAVDDTLTVDAGGVRDLDVLANDSGDGIIVGASVQSGGQGTAVPRADGTVVEYDLTTAYQELDDGDTAEVQILYLTSDGTNSDVATATVTVNGVADPLGAVTDQDGSNDEVSEGLAIGTTVGITAQAVDPDQNSTVTYDLVDDANGAFQIDPNSGVVTTAEVLDREDPGGPTRTIEVRATSSDTTTSTETFTITIRDENDTDVSVPSDSDITTSNSVIEGAAVDTTVGVTAFADDPDTVDSISYSLDDDANGAFKIDATTGVVTVADGSQIDREADISVDIAVRATSTDGTTATAVFTIAVEDVNEVDVTVPIDTVDAPGGSVDENAAIGAIIGLTAFASDDDATNNQITYSLSDDDGGRFLISATLGQVLVAGAIDREEGATRFITVRATSEDGSFAEQNFDIAINDVDEADVTAPVDSDPNDNTVGAAPATGDQTGVTVFAEDTDATNSAVTYSLLAGGLDFEIEPTTGVVTVAAGFDVNGPVTRTITVLASSSDGSSAATDFNISVGGSFNVIDGTPGRDDLVGTEGRDAINGFGDDDDLQGLGGDDILNGGAGRDNLDGGTGDDEMIGGEDNDVYVVDSHGDVVTETAGGGTRDKVFSSVIIAALYDQVELLELTGSDDLDGTGNELDNKIDGNVGDNNLFGGLGRDRLNGDDGNDTLFGGDEVDVLNGDDGDDVLFGGTGRNILFGGDGADAFRFKAVPASDKDYDRIRDFSTAEGDRIVLDASGFTAIGSTLEASELVIGTAALDADDHLVFDGSSGRLFYDADGSGSGDQLEIARLDGVASLAITDFEVV